MNVDWKTYVDQRFLDNQKAVDAALAAAKEAVDKAEAQDVRWREQANEWRGAFSDRERDFLTRREFHVLVGSAVAVIGVVLMLTR